MALKDMSLTEIIDEIKSGKTTSKEVFDYFQARIEKYDDKVQAYNFVNKDGLNTEADTDSALAGVPLGIKSLFCENGVVTNGGSKMLENFVPPYDATVIKNLKAAGMSSLGKVSMDDNAMGSTGENSAFEKSVNPWGTERVPGGSSSGSAASVAAGLAPAALGSDTG